MTDDEARALGLRAVACPGWRWLPGMCPVGGYRVLAVFGSTLFSLGAGGDAGHAGFIDRAAVGPPDFRDPATLGCLLALVRETWDRPGLYVASVASADDDGGEHWRLRDRGCSLLRHDPPMGATTEAEALVAALEVAPARVSP